MMETPICDFVKQYAQSGNLRLHMPGHKGVSFLGLEERDITEIPGADSLYEAHGIIRKSEENASRLFGCPTFYSTEGSSQCIRAMLYLAALDAKRKGKQPHIAAGRNAHKTFLSGAALLDIPVTWLYPEGEGSYLNCRLTPEGLEKWFREAADKPSAVYLTSPDYLGSTADIAGIAKVCHRYGALLMVDCAHGAYLKFLPESKHPMDLGADLCCCSAHKTLPVLTGGAYLHVGAGLEPYAKNALALFGSTSPSYLILQSLDAANRYLEGYPQTLAGFLPMVSELKKRLEHMGYCLYGDEPLKLTIASKAYGYEGTQLGQALAEKGIVCEFADPDFLVLMLTPEIGEEGLELLERALGSVPRKAPVLSLPPENPRPERILSIREAALAVSEQVPVSESLGRVLAAATVGCPPAVPVVVCGERIDENAVRCFRYYGVDSVEVVERYSHVNDRLSYHRHLPTHPS
ncbi:MAG: amino acid decarboxylase [Faecousia sp.]